MRPYFKFTLPAGTVDDGEKKVWEELKADRIDAGEAINQLREVMDAGAEVTYRSAQLMALEDNPAQAADFAKDNARKELKAQSVITCMTVLPKDSEDPNAVGCLVIGTESREVRADARCMLMTSPLPELFARRSSSSTRRVALF